MNAPAPVLSAQARLAVVRLALEGGRTARLAFRGTSMLPLFREPMTVDVEPLDARAPVGEILVFRLQDRYAAHRVIGYDGPYYLTSGDAQPEIVERIHPRSALGRIAQAWSDASARAVPVGGPRYWLAGRWYTHGRALRLPARELGRVVRRIAWYTAHPRSAYGRVRRSLQLAKDASKR